MSDLASKKSAVWPLWISFAVQQFVLLCLITTEIKLIHVSAWVSRVPIVILWSVYLAAPFVYVRPIGRRAILRSYALSGWLFVVAACAWGQSYSMLSEKFGVPVSWKEVEASYLKGEDARFLEVLKQKPNQ